MHFVATRPKDRRHSYKQFVAEEFVNGFGL